MKRFGALVLVLALLSGCTPAEEEDGRTHILCTTYPVYLFTTAVVGDAPDMEVEFLVNQQTSCLHDYTLTVEDMKAIDRADIIVMSGAGLEDFMADALAQKDVPVIDCSANVDLLPALGHHHHDEEDEDDHEVDPHYWMMGGIGMSVVFPLGDTLSTLTGDPNYRSRASAIADELLSSSESWCTTLYGFLPSDRIPLITFHDGFQYFADAFGLELLASIEEDEGSEASAKELEKIIALVEEHHIPAIFVEKNGSRRSADVIARETGCKVYELDLIMSGNGVGIEPYLQAMEQNLDTILQAFEWEASR